MADTDVTPVVARMLDLIETVPGVGRVWPATIYSTDVLDYVRDDDQRVRVWWISGPSMTAQATTQSEGGRIERTWTYRIHGALSVVDDGGELQELRALAVKVTDALDADVTLRASVHHADPCRWSIQPEHRILVGGIYAAYIEIAKSVRTLSTP